MLNLKNLKTWINSLPETELDEYNVVYRNYVDINNITYSDNKNIITICIDKETKHVVLLNDINSDILNEIEK